MNELDKLSKILSQLNEDELESLLDTIREKSKKRTIKKKKTNIPKELLDEGMEEHPKHRELSKKLNQNKKSVNIDKRQDVEMIDVQCKNCHKKYNLPVNYPNIKNFICCVR